MKMQVKFSPPASCSFVCKVCRKHFVKKSNLRKHLLRFHSCKKVKHFVCDLCKETFTHKHELVTHIRNHMVKVEEIIIGYQNVKAPNSTCTAYVCQFCNKSFTTKSNLKRHFISIHSKKEEEHYICDICKATFTRKDYLLTHVRRHSIAINLSIFECETCHRCFTSEYRLMKHFQKEHGLVSDNEDTVECDACHLKMSSKDVLRRHIYRVHLLRKEKKPPKLSQLKCLKCDLRVHRKDILLDHYKRDHSITLEYIDLVFASIEEFEKWKRPYYRAVKKWSTSTDIVRKFECHRSGIYEDDCKRNQRERQRRLKVTGSKKLQGICPAEVTVREIKGSGMCSVKEQKVHVGHDINDLEELSHIYLSRDEKKTITRPFSKHVPRNVIIQEKFRKYNSGLNDNRLNTTIERNTEKSYISSEDPFTIPDDPTYVDKFTSQYEDSIVFYKKENEKDVEFDVLEENDFVLIFQDEFQKQNLQKYGYKVVAFDRTYGTEPNDFILHTMLVADLENEAVPVAFLISNRGDRKVMDIFVSRIKDQVGVINAIAVMSDTDLSYFESWYNYMSVPQFSLFCPWQFRKTWEQNLRELVGQSSQCRKITKGDGSGAKTKVRQQIIRDLERKLNDLADDLDSVSFLSKLATFLKESNPIAEPFINYFRENYINNAQRWALCYRINAGIFVNMNVKVFHRALKNKVGKKKKIQTLSSGVYCINEYLKHRNNRVEGKLVHPVLTKRQRRLRLRHSIAAELAATSPFAIEYDVNEHIWRVPSLCTANDGVDEMYVIQENQVKECSIYPERCRLFCDLCNSCYHQYCCSCPDFAVSNNMCQHIHSLSLLRKYQAATEEKAEPLLQNVDEDLVKTVECPTDSPGVFTLVFDVEDDTSMESFHKTIQEDFQRVQEKAKNRINFQNKDMWYTVYRQHMDQIESSLDALETNKTEARFFDKKK